MKKKSALELGRLESIMWLLDPNGGRRTGRSYTMAVAYINIAMSYAGEWIIVRDHYPSYQADEMLLSMIRNWIQKEMPKIKVEFKRDCFRIMGRKP